MGPTIPRRHASRRSFNVFRVSLISDSISTVSLTSTSQSIAVVKKGQQRREGVPGVRLSLRQCRRGVPAISASADPSEGNQEAIQHAPLPFRLTVRSNKYCWAIG